ncbi:hypothetical protein [Streptomyces sp. NPDC090093]|uniref:hypothetical protein n=1 Tax=Streptomyces sp. NPDC090093 TaxID=3365945 RepID=UPI0037F8A5D5
MREAYDVYGAAGRLKVSVAAWRWAVASGLVPAADAGAGRWSRAVVQAADAEGIRAALPGVVGAWWAAERLTEALGAPLPFGRPSVTATAVGHLVRAGLLAYLGGDVATPDVHPDQVATLARRRDLPALLDRHVPLGPDQAAVRLGVRRTEWDQVVRLGWIAPVGTVEIDYKRHGGWTEVPLYSGQDVALLPLSRPSVDWRALRTLAPGRRSPLAALDPVDPAEGDTVFLAEAARIAGVGRAAVANWRRRYDDFPAPAAGTDTHPRFDRSAVVAWLLAHDKIAVPAGVPSATLALRSGDTGERRFRLDDPVLELADDADGEDRLSGWTTDTDADALATLTATYTGASLRRLTAPARPPLAVPGRVRVINRYRSGSGGLRITLAWPASLRGTADRRSRGGTVDHAVPYAAPGAQCVCVRQACGGLIPVPYCPEHGRTAEPVMEWHPAGGVRCAHLTRPAPAEQPA